MTPTPPPAPSPPARRAGILVPLFSLASSRSWGIGEIGDIARFASWLDSAGQRLLRSPLGWLAAQLPTKPLFSQQFASLFSPSHPLADNELEDQWALWTRAGGNRIAHRLIGYVGERERHAERWHGAVRDWPGTLSIVWGMLDPVATPNVLAGLRELRPHAPIAEMPDLGHYLQIEAPAVVAEAIRCAQAAAGISADRPR